MTKKKVVPNRQYTTEFKIEAVRLAESIGGNFIVSVKRVSHQADERE